MKSFSPQALALALLVASAGAQSLPPLPPTATPQPITFAWDPVSAVAGYKFYQGSGSRFYTNSVTVGDATTYAITNVDRTIANYFAATSYDVNGIESDYSNEVLLPLIPPPTNVVTFSVQILASTNVNGPYAVFKTLPAFSVTNPLGADYIRALVGVTVTNIAK